MAREPAEHLGVRKDREKKGKEDVVLKSGTMHCSILV